MSTGTDIHQQDTEAPETGLLRDRIFRVEANIVGRTADVRIVPYGERITHNDGFGGVPRGVEYEEEWLPGCFRHQLNAANRVHANFEHQKGISNVVGEGMALREAFDGFYGSFKIYETLAGDTMLEMLRGGGVDGVSLEARPVKDNRSGGVVQRVKANLSAIAFTRFAAYSGARVLALREEQNPTIDEALLPVDMDPERVKRLRALGVALPDRYQAHPDETGTPAAAGTPEDGTRQPIGTPSSEE